MSAIPPALVVDLLAILIVSQLCYAFLPYRRRAYLPVLLLAAAGFALGQLWDFIGLPAWRLGGAALIPGAVFALALQPLAKRVPIRFP